jgi:hypothetical protein
MLQVRPKKDKTTTITTTTPISQKREFIAGLLTCGQLPPEFGLSTGWRRLSFRFGMPA